MGNQKDRILDAALALFLEKGFDETSVSDIQGRLGIARGTLYYHYPSKEAIMDAIIERFGREVICEAEKAAAEKGGGILERMFALFGCMNIRRLTRDEQILDYLHRPQNALFHEKSNTMLIAALRPLLGELLREGREEGMFTNPYEEETAELILLSIIGFLDYTAMEAGKKALERRVESLLYNVERMLGAREGTLSHLKKLG